MDSIRDHQGNERRLGWKSPSADNLKMRSTKTSIQDLRAQLVPNEPPVFSLAQIMAILQSRPCDFVTGCPTALINDQGQEGACVGASCCGGLQRQMFLRGDPAVSLSWPFVYDQINGGQDNGAVIADALGAIETTGAPLLAEYPKSLWLPGKMPAGATIYREDVAITGATSLEAATMLLMGILFQGPIDVDNTFENFTGDGVAYGGRAPRSSNGNHSIYLAGIKIINGVLYFILVNSWNATWGPFQQGWCLIPFAAIDNVASAADGFGHASRILPALDPAVPAPVLAI